MPGHLYIVATPIGNIQDITLRAIKTLFSVDMIYAEEPAQTKNLLTTLKSNYPTLCSETIPPIRSLNEFEEEFKSGEVLSNTATGKNIAYVSSAGTPLISDPGYKLVNDAIRHAVPVIPIPGATAITTFLSAAGLPTDSFLFLGFPPKKSGKRQQLFSTLIELSKQTQPTVVFYESPHRIIATLQLLQETLGDIQIVIGREMTKIYEEIVTLKVSEAIERYTHPKEEFVIGLSLKNN